MVPWQSQGTIRMLASAAGGWLAAGLLLSAAAQAQGEAATEENPKIEASILGVFQRVNPGGSAAGLRQSRAGYRGDLGMEWQAGSLGGARGTAYAQARFGLGAGLGLRPTYTGSVNSTLFETTGRRDNTSAILAQAYYQLDWPLAPGTGGDARGSRLSLTAGKLDAFVFFDQNAVAGDEGAQFLNNVFVHNPLLDSGGDTAADAYGFAPGLRLAYSHAGDGSWRWGVSVGVFGAGTGANFSGSLGRPFTIAQFELSPLQEGGEPRGSYRVYVWTNGRTGDLAGALQRHSGIGLSVDQRVGDDWNVFGRYGRRTSGDGVFNRALTLGVEVAGGAWGRGEDAVGMALAWLPTGSAWRAATADTTLAGYAAGGNERVAELYYRWKVNERLDLTPDFQWIRRPGGDGAAPAIRVIGLRAALSF